MKRLSAKVGQYTNQQNETKGKYVDLGVIMANENGEYLLLDPTVNLAGVLQKQNMFAHSQGKQTRESVMVSIYDNSQQQGNGQQASSPTQQNGQQNNYDPDVPF